MEDPMEERELNRRLNRLKQNQEDKRQHQESYNRDDFKQKKQKRRASKTSQKQRLDKLKQTAQQLDLRTILEELLEEVTGIWWGPETANEKDMPSFGMFVNRFGKKTEDGQQIQSFGLWIREAKDENQRWAIYLFLGEKTSWIDDPVGLGEPPAKQNLFTRIKFNPAQVDQQQGEIAKLLKQHLPE